MENISLPSKILFKDGESANQGMVTVEPAFPGYGTTLGNALRRVLLSSLPGAAIISTKITGVQHEFATLDNVKEDVIQIILNLKQIRFKLHSEEPVTLSLKVKGERVVTAADFEKSAQAEIVNPEQVIATISDASAEFEMQVVVERGRGYSPVEIREREKGEIGMIPVDAIFTPVKNVALRIEDIRVGKMTNYNKLSLDIETDGTITPREAFEKSVKILIDQFSSLVNLEDFTDLPAEPAQEEVPDAEPVQEEAPDAEAEAEAPAEDAAPEELESKEEPAESA